MLNREATPRSAEFYREHSPSTGVMAFRALIRCMRSSGAVEPPLCFNTISTHAGMAFTRRNSRHARRIRNDLLDSGRNPSPPAYGLGRKRQRSQEFAIQNLLFGVFSAGSSPWIEVTIGESIQDLADYAEQGLIAVEVAQACQSDPLNSLMALAPMRRHTLRKRLAELLAREENPTKVGGHPQPAEKCLVPIPATIKDYTDFCADIHQANKVGRQFRPENPLLPNYNSVLIGCPGSASTIQVSGVPVTRPNNQWKALDADTPKFGPTKRLDYELELGVCVGTENMPDTAIPDEEPPNHIAGCCLLKDWSAHDFQAWEYQPLGPFLAKNLQTTICPSVLTSEAMAPFRIAQPPRPDGDTARLPYLSDQTDQSHGALSVILGVLPSGAIMRERGLEPIRLCCGPASNMHWMLRKMVAHQASKGCRLQPGDLLDTVTISALSRDGFGKLLELTTGGKQLLDLPSGETRSSLKDDDKLSLLAVAHPPGNVSMGYGQCTARILPPQDNA